MRIGSSALYTEVGICFEISYKIDLFIVDILTKKILIPHGLDKIKEDWFLELTVSTRKDLKEIDVRGPDINRRAKFITYALFLPYKEIVNSKNYLKSYLEYYFNALIIVFKNYGVKEEEIMQTLEIVKQEVIGNDKYIYEGEEIPTPDLSDLNLD